MATTANDPEVNLPLPPNFQRSNPAPILCYQGAEAFLYKTVFPTVPLSNPPIADVEQTSQSLPCFSAFLKYRPAKQYRHPILDAKLTRHRVLAEARVLVKLKKEGVPVPTVYSLDWESGWMLGEWIEGEVIRTVLDREVPLWLEVGEETDGSSNEEMRLRKQALLSLMSRIGAAVGRMHGAGVVHGDLTTSNLMLEQSSRRPSKEVVAGGSTSKMLGEVVLIDFGLAAQSLHDEDRAVDLYVLERAFGSTHPRTESLFEEVLKAYGQSYKAANVTLKRLEEVRMRGRKKIAIG